MFEKLILFVLVVSYNIIEKLNLQNTVKIKSESTSVVQNV